MSTLVHTLAALATAARDSLARHPRRLMGGLGALLLGTGVTAFGESWQRRTFLENRGVPDAEAAVYAHRKSCEQKQADLRSRQGYANNNLAGATYLQSLAAEMQATATMCDVRSRELNAELDSMKKELRELQAQQ